MSSPSPCPLGRLPFLVACLLYVFIFLGARCLPSLLCITTIKKRRPSDAVTLLLKKIKKTLPSNPFTPSPIGFGSPSIYSESPAFPIRSPNLHTSQSDSSLPGAPSSSRASPHTPAMFPVVPQPRVQQIQVRMLHRFLDETPLCVYNKYESYFFINMEELS